MSTSYVSFFLNSPSSVVNLETFQIAHVSFSKTYWIVRNAMYGITATLEDSTSQDFEYYPVALKRTGASDDLDQKFQLTLGDLGQIIPQEIDRYVQWYAANAGTLVKQGMQVVRPILTFRSFRSDALTAGPMDGPYKFQVTTTGLKKEGATLNAGAARLNLNTTGEKYQIDRVPMMRGFL